MPVKVLAAVRVDPVSGPVGTKVVLFGKGFGVGRNPEDGITFGGRPGNGVAVERYRHRGACAVGCAERSVVMKRNGQERTVGTYTVQIPRAGGPHTGTGSDRNVAEDYRGKFRVLFRSRSNPL